MPGCGGKPTEKKNRVNLDLNELAGSVRDLMERALGGGVGEDDFNRVALTVYRVQR